MRNSLKLVLVLAVISGVAGGMMALVDSFTAPKIAAYQAFAEENAYKQALPIAESFKEEAELVSQVMANAELNLIQTVRTGYQDDQQVGWVCKVVSPGYSSDITMLVGIGKDGKLGEVLVLAQQETPGLGTKVTDTEFIAQSAIKNATSTTELKVSKDGGSVQAIAGATISSRAALRGINQVLKFYNSQKGN